MHVVRPICLSCRLLVERPEDFTVAPTCLAYPDGIPASIWTEGGDHRKPAPGDRGIRFAQVPGQDGPAPGVYSPVPKDVTP